MGRRVRHDEAPAGRPRAQQPQLSRSAGGLADEVAAVLRHWTASAALSDQTQARMGETAQRFALRLQREGTGSFAAASPAQAERFIRAVTRHGTAAKLATMHARRTALRTVYRSLRELGLAAGDPTLDVALPPRGELTGRPLTGDEIALARLAAYGHAGAWTPGRAVTWALAEATAVTSEICRVRWHDLDDPDAPAAVRLPGTRRHDARTARLTRWGRRVLARRAAELRAAAAPPSALLAYTGQADPAGPVAQAAASTALATVLRHAGLATEPDIRPSSVRQWAGRTLHDAGASLPEVALALGHRSLDETALDIGLRWRTDDAGAAPRENRR